MIRELFNMAGKGYMVRHERYGGEQSLDGHAKQPGFGMEFHGELGTEMWGDENCLLQTVSVYEMDGVGVGKKSGEKFWKV